MSQDRISQLNRSRSHLPTTNLGQPKTLESIKRSNAQKLRFGEYTSNSQLSQPFINPFKKET